MRIGAEWTSLRDLLLYRGVNKSLARPTSRSILFDGENISFDVWGTLWRSG